MLFKPSGSETRNRRLSRCVWRPDYRPIAAWIVLALPTLAMAQQRADVMTPPIHPADESLPPAMAVPAQSLTSTVVGVRTFPLPVTVTNEPREVELLVSSGANTPWRVLQRKATPLEAFEVTQQADGLYWYVTRTIDQQGRLSPPADQLRPMIQVVIDTVKPKIRCDAEADADGIVSGKIEIVDATPITELLVQYLTDGAPQWIAVPADRISRDGTIRFEPTAPWKVLELRVSAVDSGSNDGHQQTRVLRPRIAQAPSRLLADAPADTPIRTAPIRTVGTPLTRRLPATAVDSVAAGGITSDPPLGGLADLFRASQAAKGQTAPSPTSGPMNPAAGPEIIPTPGFELPAPAEVVDGAPVPGQLAPGATGPVDLNSPLLGGDLPVTRPSAGSPATPGESISGTPPWSPGSAAPPRSDAQAFDPSLLLSTPRRVEDAVRPLSDRPVPDAASRGRDGQVIDDRRRLGPGVDPRYQSSRIDSSMPATPAADQPPRAPRRYSDSPAFSLDYELEAVGSSGVEKIELWGSLDDGQSWKLWGDDPDRASPFDIKTNGEGIYGFRIVVLSKNGLVSPTPRAGESADIAVVVDTTRPSVRISGAAYGEGDTTGCLVIQYQCEDANLTSRPVSLAFSPTPDGPWTTIAAGLRNEGRYVWPADPGLPRELYLRVEATDLAGNTGTYVLDRPIATQGLAPRAKIRGLQSLGTASDLTSDGLSTDGGNTATLPAAAFR